MNFLLLSSSLVVSLLFNCQSFTQDTGDQYNSTSSSHLARKIGSQDARFLQNALLHVYFLTDHSSPHAHRSGKSSGAPSYLRFSCIPHIPLSHALCSLFLSDSCVCRPQCLPSYFSVLLILFTFIFTALKIPVLKLCNCNPGKPPPRNKKHYPRKSQESQEGDNNLFLSIGIAESN